MTFAMMVMMICSTIISQTLNSSSSSFTLFQFATNTDRYFYKRGLYWARTCCPRLTYVFQDLVNTREHGSQFISLAWKQHTYTTHIYSGLPVMMIVRAKRLIRRQTTIMKTMMGNTRTSSRGRGNNRQIAPQPCRKCIARSKSNSKRTFPCKSMFSVRCFFNLTCCNGNLFETLSLLMKVLVEEIYSVILSGLV